MIIDRSSEANAWHAYKAAVMGEMKEARMMGLGDEIMPSKKARDLGAAWLVLYKQIPLVTR